MLKAERPVCEEGEMPMVDQHTPAEECNSLYLSASLKALGRVELSQADSNQGLAVVDQQVIRHTASKNAACTCSAHSLSTKPANKQ